MSITKQWLIHVGVGTFLLLASILPSLVVANIGQLPMLLGLNSPESPLTLKGWNWWSGFQGKGYEYGISDDLHYHGNKCLYIRSLPVNPPTTPAFPDTPIMRPFDIMATLSQTFKANQYRGKRMKFSAAIKSEAPEGSAALTMSIDGICRGALAFDYMYGRNITGITNWKKAEVVLDVPWESSDIQIGITMAGKGQIWASGLMFEETMDESTGTKMYEDEPKNLDFSE
jgi:hypothetical protein